MLMRVIVGLVIGAVAGVALTNVILDNDEVRVWLVNATSLLVWGGAVLAGVVAAAIAPRKFELPIAAFSVLFGSIVGLLWFGSSLSFSLANIGNILSLGGAFLISSFCLLIFAAIGGWIVGGVRSRMEENKGAGPAGGQYPQGPYR